MDDFLNIISILGALGLFIYGMKVMSDGIQKVAGKSLRSGLAKMTNTTFGGVMTGFGTTAIIQSSSATTVMIVSFVNAGLLTLKQAIGVIMGANIGTTVTALIIVIFGFKFKITAFALPLLAIAVPMILAKKDRIKHLGEFLIGFSILFIGLGELKGLVPDELPPNVQQFISDLGQYGFASTIIMVLVGTLVTILVQSSSAAIAITLTLCQKGLIPFEMAAAIVLGENIGTTITANIAAVVGNTSAKRAARAHLIFNIMGVLWMLILFNPFLRLIDSIVVGLDLGSPFERVDSIGDGLTAFHMSFNIINTLLLVWFVGFIAKVVTRLVPEKANEEEFAQLTHIKYDAPLTTEVSILSAQKETIRFAEVTKTMFAKLKSFLHEDKASTQTELRTKIMSLEELTDDIEENIASYLVKVSEAQLSEDNSLQISSLLSISHDLERVADIVYRMSRDIERGNAQGLKFTQKQNKNLASIFTKVDEAFEQMILNLNGNYGKTDISSAVAIEKAINELKYKLSKQHLKSTEKKEYDIKSAIVYRDLLFSAEKIGDHIINVSEAVCGNLGKDDEDL
ncbi:MAG: Na/Pi cotransporter family protein [Roseivirga sp.]